MGPLYYHGWILGYTFDGSNFTQKYVFCTTPNGKAGNTPGGADGGIWQAGKGLTADASGNIYCSVGNGSFDANAGGNDYGMCYLKLSPSLTVEDWYAPYDEAAQSASDLDLGNTGLVGIPGTNRLFGGATKFGSAFLLDSTNLGHFPADAAHETAIQRLNGFSGAVGQNPIAWDAGTVKYVYFWPGGSNLIQLSYDPTVGTFSPAGIYKQTSGLTGDGALAVSAQGGRNAILWAVGPGDSGSPVLRAFDATDVSKSELWDSNMNAGRDALGSTGHFQFPTVANGKVYVPTGSSSIAVYGLLTPTATTLPVFRLYFPGSLDHFYTANGAEESAAEEAGYGFEAIIGYAPPTGVSGTAPIYRLYNPYTGEHFYTVSQAERDYVSSHLGYTYEGVGFPVITSPGTGLLPLYRLYSRGWNRHFYTTSQAEHDYVIAAYGFNDEGILGYLNAP
ncbi:MAG: hypothetical protein JO250_16040 [Armatimonadetes bacterium]|nr:hypothetical protein [Armatimonadota bacterium]